MAINYITEMRVLLADRTPDELVRVRDLVHAMVDTFDAVPGADARLARRDPRLAQPVPRRARRHWRPD